MDKKKLKSLDRKLKKLKTQVGFLNYVLKEVRYGVEVLKKPVIK